MPIYITQGRYSKDAIKSLVANPEDRRKPLEAMMSASGFRLIDYYITLGQYDFLVISEGPEGSPVPLIAAAATGTVSDLTTSVAYTTAEFKTAAEKAGEVLKGFKAIGG